MPVREVVCESKGKKCEVKYYDHKKKNDDVKRGGRQRFYFGDDKEEAEVRIIEINGMARVEVVRLGRGRAKDDLLPIEYEIDHRMEDTNCNWKHYCMQNHATWNVDAETHSGRLQASFEDHFEANDFETYRKVAI